MEIIQFDPTAASLQSIIAETAKISANDLSDKKQLELVKKTRIQLRDARITIEKQGKSMREDALKYQKDVITREKELIAIIEPEEQRLKDIELEAERIKERAIRQTALPIRHAQLKEIGDGIKSNDEELLEMDAEQFAEYMNGRKLAKFEIDRIARETEERKIAHERDIEEAKKRAVEQERDRAARENADKKKRAEATAKKAIEDAKVEAARIEQAAKDKVIREEKEKQEKIREEQQMRESLEKKKKYQAWLKKIGYKEEDKSLWRFEIENGKTKAFLFQGGF